MAAGADIATVRFLEQWRGAPPSAQQRAALQGALEAALERAQTSWPRVPLPAEQFGAWLGARAPATLPADEAVKRLRAEPLYLTCACAQGKREALASFEEAFLSRVPGWLARFDLDQDALEETKQILREKLFVGGEGGAARIAQYDGRGALESWLRVAAVRTTLNVLAARRPSAGEPDEVRGVAEGLLQYDVELDYIRARYRGEFASAFRDALASMPGRQRAILRFHYLDRLTPARIGTIYHAHRTTVARWIAEAQRSLLAATRHRLMARLGISRAECDSLIRLVRSRLHVTLPSFFCARVA